ncbi:MAG: hypothetical protein IID44_21005 [Planctomycetes bacterium]|nr:hypothetical protein [Planctomycetota bacterium]
MSNIDHIVDMPLLVRWLGVQGAKAGLKNSRKCTVEVLSEMAGRQGIVLGKKATRKELIDEIVRVASARIDKSLDDLFAMDQADLERYFQEVGAEPEELLEIVKKLDLDPGREGLRNLVRFVAREISETGRFMRIASKTPAGQHTGH